MIPVYIVSGFLGSGKTTFIQHLLGQMRDTGKVMVIENDFGEVSFDSALLKKQGIRFEELASGCICCTLAGDFKKSLHKVLQEASTDCIIIEPSGVAKLSDIIAVCQDKELTGAIRLVRAVTVVDAQAGYMYAENFGEFFIDQIRCGQDIFLSHAGENEDDTRMTIAPRSALKIKRRLFIRTHGKILIYRPVWAPLPELQQAATAVAGGSMNMNTASATLTTVSIIMTMLRTLFLKRLPFTR
ncbi:GTP-binding protein [Anaeroglobus geminatus]|uniref:CobW/P47K family protein n=1 Tax=Anaeroglobus geminatus F0357 TaxID=861450 RepID=G9YFW8_9FIRM|nr:GTP-binding protein [Anaeroglobus geminatus]EHM42659.1 CobW/P47K family protein [Anaeroglobus geminatus F0357]